MPLIELIFLEIKGSAFEKASPFCVNEAISRMRCEKSVLNTRNNKKEIRKSEKNAQKEEGSLLLRSLLSGFAARKRKYPARKGARMEKIYGKACHKRYIGMKNIIRSEKRARKVFSEIKKSPHKKIEGAFAPSILLSWNLF